MSYFHLNEIERQLIQTQRMAMIPLRRIAIALGKSHSTVLRELKRNGNGGGGYVARAAQALADARACMARVAPRMESETLRGEVTAMLEKDWSPEIISARLKASHPDEPAMQLSHESIYQWVYRDAKAGGRLFQHLWRKKHQRTLRASRSSRRCRIPDRVDIDERPPIVAGRSRAGDWEGDTVAGKGNKGGVATVLERASRFVMAGLVANKQAATFTTTVNRLLGKIPLAFCHTLTLDNGSEMAAHGGISQSNNGMAVYFAHPHSPWQRGANEQVNGMIRRYFPKGTDFSKVSHEALDQVILKINQRPRKCLGYQAPYDVFARMMAGALGA